MRSHKANNNGCYEKKLKQVEGHKLFHGVKITLAVLEGSIYCIGGREGKRY